MIARLMRISVLDELKSLKKPVLVFANINTDIITIYVVFMAVFVTKSIAIFLLMVLYLRYYFIVHNGILDIL